MDQHSGLVHHPHDYYQRYSRQHYVLEERAMNKMALSNVFISGLGGVGVEIAKNVALAGVNQLCLHDTVSAMEHDLGTQYYMDSESLGQNRAKISLNLISKLNPYVTYMVDTRDFDLSNQNWHFLDQYTCVVLTEKSLALQKIVGQYCHEHDITFISADVLGVFGIIFCDFGEQHHIFDPNGEPERQVLIEKIQLGEETIVICIEGHPHGFEVGDWIKFTEVEGTIEFNIIDESNIKTSSFISTKSRIDQNLHCITRVISPLKFSLGTNSSHFSPYKSNGIATQVKVPSVMSFLSLRDALSHPKFLISDFAKMDKVESCHIGFQALHLWADRHDGQWPQAWNLEQAQQVVSIAQAIYSNSAPSADGRPPLDTNIITQLSFCARGSLIGITAVIGGFTAQEVIKALSGKFTPLNQFFYFDACEILQAMPTSPLLKPHHSRYTSQLIVLDPLVHTRLMNTQVFLIGAGAIGCEMLKNMAMLGVSTGRDGKIVITDHDLIEISNLNRQFLFRECDVQKPKSITAARASKAINPELQIEAFLDKVGPETENIYNDQFFQSLDVVINALDNIPSRLYVDQRCVANSRPLLESGTTGTKGHVQAICPNITESYGSQIDPVDEVYPVCTIKSFPTSIEHTIQWALSKFESLFVEKPAQIVKFLNNSQSYIDNLKSCSYTSSVPRHNILKHLVKTLESPPRSFDDCLIFALLKFESYYHHQILHLLDAFPLDTKTLDGSPFWRSPKRPPVPLEFDLTNKQHLDFILSTALLYASVYNIRHSPEDQTVEHILSVFSSITLPPYVMKKNKRIEIDPNVKEEKVAIVNDPSELDGVIERLENCIQSLPSVSSSSTSALDVSPQVFEKDVDCNYHIAFINACSNLRALNYRLNVVDRLKTKLIAGKIIPAIATTTAVVAGLVSLELIKLIQKQPISSHKNAFFNLSLPYFQLSEPGLAMRNYITPDLYYTLWDRWEVNIGDVLIEEFIQYLLDKYRLQVTAICHGVLSLYIALMPMHKARLKKKLSSLLKNVATGQNYVDLVVTFQDESGEDVNAPDIRFVW